MRSIFGLFFPSLYRQPVIGERYVFISEATNSFEKPFCHTVLAVLDVKDGWVKVGYGSFGSTRAISLGTFVAFYRLIKP